MKKYILAIAISCSLLTVFAQRIVDKQITVKPDTKIDLKLDFADSIHIKQSNDNILKVKVLVNINDNLHNDKYELVTNQDNQYLDISAEIHDMNTIRVPCRNSKGSHYVNYDGNCLTMDIYYEIEVPQVSNIRIETICGNIIVDKGINPMQLKSISGFIDLSIPSTSNLDIKIGTVTGGVYTNYVYNKDSDDWESHPCGTEAYIRIGKGGNKIRLETVSGDIYLRKL